MARPGLARPDAARAGPGPPGGGGAGCGESGAVRVGRVLVEREDRGIPPAVPQVVLGDLPQALVEPAPRRLHHVDLLGAVRPATAVPVVRARLGRLRAVAARGTRARPELLAHLPRAGPPAVPPSLGPPTHPPARRPHPAPP